MGASQGGNMFQDLFIILKPGTVWLAACLVFLSCPARVLAQSSPADLTDLSLSELMDVDIERQSPRTTSRLTNQHGRWHFRYSYIRKKFNGYRDGTHQVSNEAVLFRPGEVRTKRNFPVLPTEIIQEAHTADVSFDVTNALAVSLVIPYLRQSTDHISIVPGFDKFNISSSGIGDLSLSTSYALWRAERQAVRVSAGMSFPTGSIHERGDTPRAPGNQRLPYTMQLGSGTYDVLGSLHYNGYFQPFPWVGPLSWGGQLFGKIRTGKNSRGYRLGDMLILSTWLQAKPFSWLEPSVKLVTQFWGRIDGQDGALLVPGPFPFPAPVTNPNFFGGTKISILAGVRLSWPTGFLKDSFIARLLRQHSIEIEVGPPIYQSLNGPQPEEDLWLSLSWQWKI